MNNVKGVKASVTTKTGSKCCIFLNGPTPSFLSFSLDLTTRFQKNWKLQRDSNSDRWSRRRARWPLDHHHGPSKAFIFTVGRLNAKLAWFVQESPAFIIPCLLLAEKWEQTGITEKILLIMFLIHYFQRYVAIVMSIHSLAQINAAEISHLWGIFKYL